MERDLPLFIQLGLLLAFPCGAVGFYVIVEPILSAWRRRRERLLVRRRLFSLCREVDRNV